MPNSFGAKLIMPRSPIAGSEYAQISHYRDLICSPNTSKLGLIAAEPEDFACATLIVAAGDCPGALRRAAPLTTRRGVR